jgi:hypothetical protein
MIVDLASPKLQGSKAPSMGISHGDPYRTFGKRSPFVPKESATGMPLAPSGGESLWANPYGRLLWTALAFYWKRHNTTSEITVYQ